jgi:hypothetical protein
LEGLEAGVRSDVGWGGDLGLNVKVGDASYPCNSCFWMNMFSWMPPISCVNLNASHVVFAGACRGSNVGRAATRPRTLRSGRRCSCIV